MRGFGKPVEPDVWLYFESATSTYTIGLPTYITMSISERRSLSDFSIGYDGCDVERSLSILGIAMSRQGLTASKTACVGAFVGSPATRA